MTLAYKKAIFAENRTHKNIGVCPWMALKKSNHKLLITWLYIALHHIQNMSIICYLHLKEQICLSIRQSTHKLYLSAIFRLWNVVTMYIYIHSLKYKVMSMLYQYLPWNGIHRQKRSTVRWVSFFFMLFAPSYVKVYKLKKWIKQ